MNLVALVGRMVRDPEYKVNGESGVARFTIAVDRRFKNSEGKYEADFINCVAFKQTAEFISKYFFKGMRIGITGHIQTGSYTNKDGMKVYTTDVIVDSCEFVESKNENSKSATTEAPVPDLTTVVDDTSDMDELPFN